MHGGARASDDQTEVIRVLCPDGFERRMARAEAQGTYGLLSPRRDIPIDGRPADNDGDIYYVPALYLAGAAYLSEKRHRQLTQQEAAVATKHAQSFKGRKKGADGPLKAYLRGVCDVIGSRSFDPVLKEIEHRAATVGDDAQEVDRESKVVYFRFDADHPVPFKTIRNRLSEIGKQKKNPGMR